MGSEWGLGRSAKKRKNLTFDLAFHTEKAEKKAVKIAVRQDFLSFSFPVFRQGFRRIDSQKNMSGLTDMGQRP